MPSTPEILRLAAAEVRKGWCQHRTRDRDANMCAVGAIRVAAGGAHHENTWTAAYKYLCQTLGLHFLQLSDWNDAPGQTAENVATAMEYAALLFEQEQHAQLELNAEQDRALVPQP